MPEEIKDKYYKIQVACANCGKGSAYDIEEYMLFIPKGIEADVFFEKTPCANCGCHTLTKVIPFVNPIIRKKEKQKKEDEDSQTNDLNDDMPRIDVFKKKPKLRVKKIIK